MTKVTKVYIIRLFGAISALKNQSIEHVEIRKRQVDHCPGTNKDNRRPICYLTAKLFKKVFNLKKRMMILLCCNEK